MHLEQNKKRRRRKITTHVNNNHNNITIFRLDEEGNQQLLSFGRVSIDTVRSSFFSLSLSLLLSRLLCLFPLRLGEYDYGHSRPFFTPAPSPIFDLRHTFCTLPLPPGLGGDTLSSLLNDVKAYRECSLLGQNSSLLSLSLSLYDEWSKKSAFVTSVILSRAYNRKK